MATLVRPVLLGALLLLAGCASPPPTPLDPNAQIPPPKHPPKVGAEPQRSAP